MLAVVCALRSANCDVILMSGAPSEAGVYASYATQASYVENMKSLAYAADVPFVDVWGLFGTWNASAMYDSLLSEPDRLRADRGLCENCRPQSCGADVTCCPNAQEVSFEDRSYFGRTSLVPCVADSLTRHVASVWGRKPRFEPDTQRFVQRAEDGDQSDIAAQGARPAPRLGSWLCELGHFPESYAEQRDQLGHHA